MENDNDLKVIDKLLENKEEKVKKKYIYPKD